MTADVRYISCMLAFHMGQWGTCRMVNLSGDGPVTFTAFFPLQICRKHIKSTNYERFLCQFVYLFASTLQAVQKMCFNIVKAQRGVAAF